MDNPEKLTT